jgi:hypothetical protein
MFYYPLTIPSYFKNRWVKLRRPKFCVQCPKQKLSEHVIRGMGYKLPVICHQSAWQIFLSGIIIVFPEFIEMYFATSKAFF